MEIQDTANHPRNGNTYANPASSAPSRWRFTSSFTQSPVGRNITWGISFMKQRETGPGDEGVECKVVEPEVLEKFVRIWTYSMWCIPNIRLDVFYPMILLIVGSRFLYVFASGPDSFRSKTDDSKTRPDHIPIRMWSCIRGTRPPFLLVRPVVH